MRKALFSKRREGGQSVVELALTLPLVLLLIFGMVEMGWLISARQSLDTMTREGARAGIVAATTTASRTAVSNRVTAVKPPYMKNAVTVTVTFSNAASFKDGDITVATAYNLPPLSPLTEFLTEDGTYHLHSTYTLKMG
jgi:Flp pilus assembly protein TadG